MTDPLWQKAGVDIDERIMRFLAGEDVLLDRSLFLYDIKATRAHVEGLGRIDILSATECRDILTELDKLAEDFNTGQFVLDGRFEDGHTAIEDRLTERLGDAGRKVHTGRSRNDQVLVATRLYLIDTLGQLREHCRDIATLCVAEADKHRDVPMPGYTHLQRAVVSSLGHWYAAIAEAFIDNGFLAASTGQWLSANPLGTAAGFGVNLPLDRQYTTQQLGFERMQINPLYAQSSRGKFELQALAALSNALLDLRRLSWELSLYTTAEFAFLKLPARFTTGSSIMPQKRNPDIVELLRAEYSRTQGAMCELQSVLSLPAGYHRDLQATKGPLLRAMNHGLAALALAPDLLANLNWDTQRLAAAIEPEMYATDLAMELAADDIPFREAYRQAAAMAAQLTDRDPAASLSARVSAGSPGNLLLDQLQARLDTLPQP